MCRPVGSRQRHQPAVDGEVARPAGLGAAPAGGSAVALRHGHRPRATSAAVGLASRGSSTRIRPIPAPRASKAATTAAARRRRRATRAPTVERRQRRRPRRAAGQAPDGRGQQPGQPGQARPSRPAARAAAVAHADQAAARPVVLLGRRRPGRPSRGRRRPPGPSRTSRSRPPCPSGARRGRRPPRSSSSVRSRHRLVPVRRRCSGPVSGSRGPRRSAAGAGAVQVAGARAGGCGTAPRSGPAAGRSRAPATSSRDASPSCAGASRACAAWSTATSSDRPSIAAPPGQRRRPARRAASAASAAAAACHSSVLGSIAQWAGPGW